jgi:hypothetical protein
MVTMFTMILLALSAPKNKTPEPAPAPRLLKAKETVKPKETAAPKEVVKAPEAPKPNPVPEPIVAAPPKSPPVVIQTLPPPLPKPKFVPPPVTFEELYKAALDDAKQQAPEDLPFTRYIDARFFPADKLAKRKQVFDVQINSMSRESVITHSREVKPWLWAVKFDDYQWPETAFEDLVRVNFYGAISVELMTAASLQEDKKKNDIAAPRAVEPSGVAPPPVKKKEFVPGPWLPVEETVELMRLLRTQVPIIRADLFITQTSVQADRAGHGYYDFLGFKALADVEKLTHLDRKAAIELKQELGAIVIQSGVTLHNRQLFRLQALTGPWWESRDVDDNTGVKNAASNFLEDFKPDAFEIVFTLPNKLPGFYLADKAGKQQDTAPDFIAGDQRSTNNDRRVHVGYSCVTCHTDGGLRPMRDWVRHTYRAETGLALGSLSLDREKSRRLNSVYLGPMPRTYKRDASDFTEAIGEASRGLTPTDLAKGLEEIWTEYLDEPVTLEKAAAETGLTPSEFRDKLVAYAKEKRVLDPILATYTAQDPFPLRREHFEERFGLLMLILTGANP